MIILVIVGFLVGILASFSGLGGGFLVVPILVFLGKEVKLAVGTSFLFILFVAIFSVVAHFRLGHIDWKTGLTLAAGGVLGAQVGPLALSYFPDQIFKRVFAVFLIATGAWLIWDSRGGL
ncbi:MAG: sulfite exporter TauE/SafE family protein [Nitrospinales bacterium]